VLCGMVNHRQQQIIEFQNAQIEALLNKLGRNPHRIASGQHGAKLPRMFPVSERRLLSRYRLTTEQP